MYCAVLKAARTNVFRRTMIWDTSPVMKAITRGQGGENSNTAARNGMKTTDEPIPEVEIRGDGMKEESLAIPKIVKATTAFQNGPLENEGMYQSVNANKSAAPAHTITRSKRKPVRSN